MTTTSQRLAGKVAIIVGAGQQPGETVGNGRAVAERFAEEGARLLLVDIQPESLKDTEDKLRSMGAEVASVLADITREDDCARIAAQCVATFGRIDVLHNNVGRSKGDKSTVELGADMWDEIMAMNLKGMFMTCKHVLPQMIAQKEGSIINISSTSSLSARPTVAYKTSKGAVNTFTQHLAYENAAHGVRANAILPGLIDTPMAIERRARERGVSREIVRAEREAMVPMKRMGTAWDVAHAAVFLASDESRYVTGVLLPVDGGLVCKRG
ncbi:SDR family oxidoreductase [Alicycliphilus denitrificans]|uniref:3-oxoacyl-(Acyl-carrier-protein) reductase n=2 Tax=Alicycliphilus denitrificans TaxID=179636 RepID=F4GCR1_ALIDK|nr:SDR family NAD(P)-dependent oxidoreductase [Alicycliphilus denitrificans]ADU97869.1 short-chain dehydrogenase/reductase SDR [Alicycliphilus denitrificans BC]AEB82514.1 3-oxoacyl-(acyl-carrier-protein) reductase [Alicycliphilus denitrificans K601]QKD42196.1 SDR family oxidoreductase [Alicycliphilus denitrificans]